MEKYHIDGPLNKDDRVSAWVIPCFFAFLAALCLLVGVPWVVYAILLGCGTFAGVVFGRTRLIVDERGTQVREMFSGMKLLSWGELRTAAIIRHEQYRLIVLSSETPEQVLNMRHIRAGGGKPGQEHRIPWREDAVKAIEHYLGKKLPEISL